MNEDTKDALPPWTPYVLTLFVFGPDESSRRAATHLRRLCDELVGGQYRLEVVDVGEDPELAEEFGIFVTPTVVRTQPLPQFRVIGDLSDDARTAAALGFPAPLDPLERRRSGDN
ncbi:hypothetical protein GCM10009872_39990 [Actinopolymorpha rutila]